MATMDELIEEIKQLNPDDLEKVFVAAGLELHKLDEERAGATAVSLIQYLNTWEDNQEKPKTYTLEELLKILQDKRKPGDEDA